jgi:hypothetical protein
MIVFVEDHGFDAIVFAQNGGSPFPLRTFQWAHDAIQYARKIAKFFNAEYVDRSAAFA